MPESEQGKKAVATKIIVGAAQVLTCQEEAPDIVGCINQGAVILSNDRILDVGSLAEISARHDLSQVEKIDAKGGIVVPGFVDCHTHLVFAGSRVAEYAQKVTGATAADLKRLGIPSGIPATVRQLGQTSRELLELQASERVDQMVSYGTTTIESKSGYGLSTKLELLMLEINQTLNNRSDVDVVSTFLGAHEFPEDRSRETYIAEILNEMIPAVAERGLAEFNDVYCDDGYYTIAESRKILETGLDHGLQIKIHTDAYSHIGGSTLAADLNAVSADHLNYTDVSEYALLRDAGVVGVVMPALDFSVGHKHPFSARMMLDHGMTLALATDMCPGCWLESMPFVIQLACRLYAFSPAEALKAATFGAAKSLRRQDEIGSLEVGKCADIAIFDLPQFEDLAYRLGRGRAAKVIKSGKVVYRNQALNNG